MQVFVQMVSTGRLLKTDAVWVESKEEARKFPDPSAALNYCIAHGIEGARFLVTSADSKTDTYMDLFGAEKRWVASQIQMG